MTVREGADLKYLAGVEVGRLEFQAPPRQWGGGCDQEERAVDVKYI
jgi:hypothetical protein